MNGGDKVIDFTTLSLKDYNKELEDFGFHHVKEENIQAIIQLFEKYKYHQQFVESIDYYYKDDEHEYDDKIASLYCGTLRNQEDRQFIDDRHAVLLFADYSPEQCWIVQSNHNKQWYMVVR